MTLGTGIDEVAQAIEQRMKASRRGPPGSSPDNPLSKKVQEDAPEVLGASDDQSDEGQGVPDVQEKVQEATEGQEPADEVVLSNLDEVARELGVDPEALRQSITERIKVQGEELDIPLGELRQGYMREKDYRQKTMALADDRRALDEELNGTRANMEQAFTQIGAVLQQAEGTLLGDFQSIDWDDLEQRDPANFAAKRQRFGERFQQIQGLKRQALVNMQTAVQQQQAKQAAEFENAVRGQVGEIRKHIPEWADQATRERELGELQTYLVSTIGYKPEDLSGIFDNRPLRLARKAMLYDKLMADKKKAGERREAVVQRGVVRTKSPTSIVVRRRAEDTKRLARLRETGSVDDAAAILFERAQTRRKG